MLSPVLFAMLMYPIHTLRSLKAWFLILPLKLKTSLFLFLIIISFSYPAFAKIGDNQKYAALVIDLDSGKRLYSQHAKEKRYPASLTKLMTMYLTFEALEEERLKLDQRLLVSKKAASQPQTRISFFEGERITVEDLLKALAVRSANDAAVVLAEGINDSEMHFSLMMSQKARELGMKNTIFRNSSGLPDRRQYTTAQDLAILSKALIDNFPQYYYIFSQVKFYNHFDEFKSRNPVLLCYPGVDGLKTGFINDSGFNLITIIENNGKHLLAVVLGGDKALERDRHMVNLLDKYLGKKAALIPLMPEFQPVCDKLANS